MADINTVILTGRLVYTPELKKTQSGKSVLTAKLACQRTKEITDFISVIAWERQAEFLANYAKKGDKVSAEGKLQTRKDGERTVLEIVADEVQILQKAANNGGNG